MNNRCSVAARIPMTRSETQNQTVVLHVADAPEDVARAVRTAAYVRL